MKEIWLVHLLLQVPGRLRISKGTFSVVITMSRRFSQLHVYLYSFLQCTIGPRTRLFGSEV